MTRFLTIDEILYLHTMLIKRFGGLYGIRDRGLLESAVARPQMTFEGKLLYDDLYGQAAAIGHSLLLSHPFFDGNKRTAFAAMDLFFQENGKMIAADDDESEKMILNVIGHQYDEKDLAQWLLRNVDAL